MYVIRNSCICHVKECILITISTNLNAEISMTAPEVFRRQFLPRLALSSMNVTCNTFWVRKVAFQNTFPHSSPAIFVIKSLLHSLTRGPVIPDLQHQHHCLLWSKTWIKVDARGWGVQSEFWNLLTFDFGEKNPKFLKIDLSVYVDVGVYAHKLWFTLQLCWNYVGIDWLIDWLMEFNCFTSSRERFIWTKTNEKYFVLWRFKNPVIVVLYCSKNFIFLGILVLL